MGFLDKLKNVFFEEEEVEEEVEEQPKLARKVELPKKKPTVSVEVKEEIKPVIKFEEFEEEEEKEEPIHEEIRQEVKEEPSNKFAMMFEEDDFVLEETPKVMSRELNRERLERRELYPEKKEESYSESIKKESNYGYTKSYYEAKETKTFRPSPIISPIYGILDKNYKKEEVITKKEIKIMSTRDKVDLDTVRSKAFGDKDNNDEATKVKEIVTRVEKEEKIYDVSKNKPSVKGVTLEDADEYYRDLGLAYNVDYSDNARDKEIKQQEESKLEDNLFDLIESMYDKED